MGGYDTAHTCSSFLYDLWSIDWKQCFQLIKELKRFEIKNSFSKRKF